ncbi:MAG TPA: hypothetical protein PLQ09_03220, partial [Prolixibacteraceae bacterium]|nr:hypothetical protein [Prolixibacteraceae bacterium]
MKCHIYIILLFLVIYSCSSKKLTDDKVGIPEAPVTEFFAFDSSQLSIEGDIQPFNSQITIDTLGENLLLLNLTLYTDFPSALPSFAFKIKYPRNLIGSLWSSRTWSSNSYINIPNYSRLQSDVSVVSGIGATDNNVITLATYDNFASRYT